ncbi:MAG: HupE/UreJ family protein [Saprospiraceae bacterium]|nr:HupE/UreJ family protein [Saprospiraceae bacterium]
MNRIRLLPILLLSFFALNCFQLLAHEPDHSYLYLRVYENSIGGHLEVLPRDLNRELNLNLAVQITEKEVANHFELIREFLKERFSFSSSGEQYSMNIKSANLQVVDDMSENFINVEFELDGVSTMPDNLTIENNTFFQTSPNHNCLVIMEYNWKAGVIDNHTLISDVFDSGTTQVNISLAELSLWKGFWAMIKLGMWHIWIGLDHILFLVALALPSVVRRKDRSANIAVLNKLGDSYSPVWRPVARFRPAAIYIITIVTFFTIAHSVTLAVAALGYVNLPSRYVESIIALSIGLAAFHNIRPIFGHREWLIAFVFGLFHGFGFASVLGEKGISGDFLVLSLLGFNIGVEIGQVLIIAAIFPVLYYLRTFRFYPKILTYGSVLLILISLHWFFERFFDVVIPIKRWAGKIISPLANLLS